MILYDVEGNLGDANRSALDLIGTSKIEDFREINLFDNYFIPFDNEKLTEEGLARFKVQFSFDIINKKTQSFSNRETDLIEGIILGIDSGFLVQIQHVCTDKILKELLVREKKYRSFFEEDLTGDFIATPEGKILECNPAFVEIYGFDSVEDASKTDISQFNPEDWENSIKLLETEHKLKDHQTTHQRPDGKQINVVSNLVAICNEFGELDHVKGFIFDDTERKKAEEALMESEKKYHLLFDEDLTGDFIATPEGKISECNPAFAEIYGFNNCEDALKWNYSESNPFDWPYMITRLRSEGKIMGFQSWQRRSDAMRIHVVANLVGILDESGELKQVKGYVFDDTERKKAEEELDRGKNQITTILDSIKDGFVALNNFWNIIYANPCAADYVGIDIDDIIGQNLWQRFPELVGTIYETSFRKAMNDNEIQHFETQGLRKTHRWIEISVYPFEDGISIYWKDITKRKNL